jgi:hypothetical protein
MRRASGTPRLSGLPVGPLDSDDCRGILRGPSSMIGVLVRMRRCHSDRQAADHGRGIFPRDRSRHAESL